MACSPAPDLDREKCLVGLTEGAWTRMTPMERAELETEGEALLGFLTPNASARKIDLNTP
ncbi:MAG: hypothetical protein ACLQBX_09340 [Candidatus Limnocylindrales bacterium]